MGKITKAFTTGISTRRRRELKVCVLLTSHDFFKICFEFENFIQCNTEWCRDIDNSFHSIGRVIEITASAMNFSKSHAELCYIKQRIRKYLIPVLDVIIDGILRQHKSTFTHNWDDRNVSDNTEYNETEKKIIEFKKKSIKRLKLIL